MKVRISIRSDKQIWHLNVALCDSKICAHNLLSCHLPQLVSSVMTENLLYFFIFFSFSYSCDKNAYRKMQKSTLKFIWFYIICLHPSRSHWASVILYGATVRKEYSWLGSFTVVYPGVLIHCILNISCAIISEVDMYFWT